MLAERLNPDGTVDGGFGSGGTALASALGASGIANAVAVAPDGKIVLAGAVNPSDTRIALARLNSDGSPDASFGSGGTKVVDLGLPYAAAEGVAVQADGKIVLAGREQGSAHYAFFNGLVVRLNPDGSRDASFAGSGVFSYHKAGGGYDSLNAVAVQSDGKIVAGGVDTENSPYALFVRLSPDGTLDPGFGSGGVATLSAGTFTNVPVGDNGIGIAGGGRIVGAGAVQQNGTDFRAGLFALTTGGSPETQFGSPAGGDGVVEQQTGAEACALAVAPDGSLLVAGDTVSALRAPGAAPCAVNATSSAFVARYIGFGPPPAGLPPPPPPPTGSAPAASTGAARSIRETSATVAGTVAAGGSNTTYHFEYGSTTAYGSSTRAAGAGAGTASLATSAGLSRLRPATTYHYRLVATNARGSARGADRTFRTNPRLRVSLHRLAGSYRTSIVARRGLVLEVRCNQACSLKGSLVISAGAARRLHLGRHMLTIAGGSTRLRRGGTARLRINFSQAAKRTLGHQRTVSSTLRIVATPIARRDVVRLSKRLALKR